MATINEEAIGIINEAVIIAPGYPPSCFFISCLTVPVVPSINRPDFSSNSAILIISSTSLFEINRLSHFPALATPRPLISLLNLSNSDEVALVGNLAKTSLAKGIPRFNNALFA